MQRPAVDEQGATDAHLHGDVQDGLRPRVGAVPDLGEAREGGVVADLHGRGDRHGDRPHALAVMVPEAGS